MKRIVTTIFCVTTAISTSAAAQEQSAKFWTPGAQPLKFDLNIDGGLGKALERNRMSGFVRARLGVLQVLNGPTPDASPLYISGGATLACSDISPLAVGAQGEVMHLGTGLWAQAGGFVDVITPSPGLALAAGWSLVGFEAQYRFVDQDRQPDMPRADWVLYGKLRAPITIIMSAF